MSNASLKKSIRFPPELYAALERKAQLNGLASAEFVRRVVEREISGRDTEAVLNELRAIRRDLTTAMAEHGADQKAFAIEAALGLGERLAKSNEALVRQLLGSLPETSGSGGSSLSDVLPGLSLNN